MSSATCRRRPCIRSAVRERHPTLARRARPQHARRVARAHRREPQSVPLAVQRAAGENRERPPAPPAPKRARDVADLSLEGMVGSEFAAVRERARDSEGEAHLRAARGDGEEEARSRMPTRRAPAARRARRRACSSSCRQTCWASCSTSYRSPTTSRRVDVPPALDAAKLAPAAILWQGKSLSGRRLGESVAAPTAVSCTRRRHINVRDGACERIKTRHLVDLGAVAALPAERASSAADDRTVKLWTPDGTLERTFIRCNMLSVAPLPDGVHFVAGSGHATSGCTTSTGRSSTPSGATSSVWAVAVTPDGQHIISGSGDTRQGVERRHQEPGEHRRRAHRRGEGGGGDARRPALPQRRRTAPSGCGSSTAPSNTFNGGTYHR